MFFLTELNKIRDLVIVNFTFSPKLRHILRMPTVNEHPVSCLWSLFCSKSSHRTKSSTFIEMVWLLTDRYLNLSDFLVTFSILHANQHLLIAAHPSSLFAKYCSHQQMIFVRRKFKMFECFGLKLLHIQPALWMFE